MVGSASAGREAPVAPGVGVLCGLAVAVVVAAGTSVWLGFNSDHVDEPAVQGALMAWMVLGYGLAGLVAWSRRPGPFGPLMVIVGFAIFLSSLSWANGPVLFTIGITFDLVPVVVFLHVVLAFPTGRLETRVRACARRPWLRDRVGRADHCHGTRRLRARQLARPRFAARHRNVGVARTAVRARRGLPRRDRRARRPATRLGSPASAHVRAARRLLRPRSGDDRVPVPVGCIRSGRRRPCVRDDPSCHVLRDRTRADRVPRRPAPRAPAALRCGRPGGRAPSQSGTPGTGERARARGGRSVGDARVLVARVRELRRSRRPTGHLADAGRPGRSDADREGRRAGRRVAPRRVAGRRTRAARLRDCRGGDRDRERTAAVGAPGARRRARGFARAVIAVGQDERQRLERNLHDGAQQRLVALSLDLGRLEEQVGGDEATRARLEQARQQIAVSLAELRDVARGIHPAVVSAHGLAVALEELAARAPGAARPDGRARRKAARTGRGGGVLRGHRRASRTSASTHTPRGRRCWLPERRGATKER